MISVFSYFQLYRLTYWSRHRTEIRQSIDDYFSRKGTNSTKQEIAKEAYPDAANEFFTKCKKNLEHLKKSHPRVFQVLKILG